MLETLQLLASRLVLVLQDLRMIKANTVCYIPDPLLNAKYSFSCILTESITEILIYPHDKHMM